MDKFSAVEKFTLADSLSESNEKFRTENSKTLAHGECTASGQDLCPQTNWKFMEHKKLYAKMELGFVDS